MMDRIWFCRDGRGIRVSEMETAHLVNAINLILRHGSWRREYLDRLLLEVEIRNMGLSSRRGTST